MKKLITLFLSAILTVCALAFTGCGSSDSLEKLNEANLNIRPGESNGMSIIVLTSETAQSEYYLEKTLQATVTGSTTNSQPLDLEWSVDAVNSQYSEYVSEYLDVREDAYDQTLCSVKLLYSLEIDCVITVRCLNNNISATCLVEYAPYARSVRWECTKILDSVDEVWATTGLSSFLWDVFGGNGTSGSVDTTPVENELTVYELDTSTYSYTFELSALDFFNQPIAGKKVDVSVGSAGMFYMSYKGLENYDTQIYTLKEFCNNTSLYGQYLKYSYNEDTNSLTVWAINSIENLTHLQGTGTDYNNYNAFHSYANEEQIPYVFFIFSVDGEAFARLNVRVVNPMELSLPDSVTFE